MTPHFGIKMRRVGIVILGIVLVLGFGIATSLFLPAKRVLRVGIVPSGDEFCRSGGGGFSGVDPDTAGHLAKLLGFKDVEFLEVSKDDARDLISSNKIDIYIGPEIRGGLVFFRGSVTVLVRARGEPLNSIRDLRGKVVAAPEGSAIASWARRNLLAGGLISDLREYGRLRDAIIDLRVGKVQAVLIWTEVAKYALEGQPLRNYLSIEVGPNRVILAGDDIDISELGEAIDQLKSSDQWFDILNSSFHLR